MRCLLLLFAALTGCAALPLDPRHAELARERREAPVPSVMTEFRNWFIGQGATDTTILRLVSNQDIAESVRFTPMVPWDAKTRIVDIFYVAADDGSLWKACYRGQRESDGEGWRFTVREPLRRQDPPAKERRGGGPL